VFLEISRNGYPYSAVPGLAILPGFQIILFGGAACKFLIPQEPALGELPGQGLLCPTADAQYPTPELCLQRFSLGCSER